MNQLTFPDTGLVVVYGPTGGGKTAFILQTLADRPLDAPKIIFHEATSHELRHPHLQIVHEQAREHLVVVEVAVPPIKFIHAADLVVEVHRNYDDDIARRFVYHVQKIKGELPPDGEVYLHHLIHALGLVPHMPLDAEYLHSLVIKRRKEANREQETQA